MRFVSDAFYMHAQVDYILANFDFEKVASVMDYLDWTWRDKLNSPSVEELKESAHKMLIQAAEAKGEYLSATGGFEVFKDAEGVIGLKFIVAEWDNAIQLETEEEYVSADKSKLKR